MSDEFRTAEYSDTPILGESPIAYAIRKALKEGVDLSGRSGGHEPREGNGMSDEFATPDEARPQATDHDRVNWRDLNGALIMIEPYALEEKMQTTFTNAENPPKDAVRSDVSIIDGKYKGRFYEDQLIFGVRMVDQLKTLIGKKVLARFEVVKAGRGTMYQLDGNVTEKDKADARDFKRPDEFSAPSDASDDSPPF